MRRIRYAVVMSLDGYIAGPKGEAGWITNGAVICVRWQLPTREG
jgi:hypothetical protein